MDFHCVTICTIAKSNQFSNEYQQYMHIVTLGTTCNRLDGVILSDFQFVYPFYYFHQLYIIMYGIRMKTSILCNWPFLHEI